MSEHTMSEQEAIRQQIHQIFTQFDKNNNNTIDKSELHTLCIALNNPLSPGINQKGPKSRKLK